MVDPKARVPLRVAVVYAGLGLLYIFASDWIVEAEMSVNWKPSVQTWKGAAFVIVMAAVIAILIRQELRRYRRMEKAFVNAQRLEAVGQLTGGIAHDFNNLLMAVLGNLELIEMQPDAKGDVRRRLRNAVLAVERGADLTRRMLALSRNQVLAPRLTDPNGAIREMRPLLASALREKVQVDVQLAADAPPVLVDPGQLESALLNLVVNARDAMPQGGSLSLSTKVVSIAGGRRPTQLAALRPGRYLVVEVADDGDGMAEAIQARLFEPFFTTKPDGKGTGLGLVMVQAFARQAGGDVAVFSIEGRGTTVKLFLPAAEVAPDRCSAAVMAAAPPRGRETILLVENDESVREVMVDFLAGLGYRVLRTDRAREALALLDSSGSVDLLLTDIILGGERTGIDLAKEVRRLSPRTALLLVSGYADPIITGQLADFARVGWLAKPFHLEALGRAVREAIDR